MHHPHTYHLRLRPQRLCSDGIAGSRVEWIPSVRLCLVTQALVPLPASEARQLLRLRM